MSNIRLKKITIEPSSGSLIIQNNNINITDTRISSNVLNGALVLNGGIGINCTYDSVSSTSGGALSIGGGLSVYKQSYFGNNITLDNAFNTLSINGISTNRMFLDSTTNKQFYISVDGITQVFTINQNNILINITSNSTNASSGALIVNGGISINSTTNVSNSTQGGALTVDGGASFNKDVVIGNNLNVNNNLNVTSILNLGTSNIYSSSGTLYINNNSNINFNSSIGNFNFYNNTNISFQITNNFLYINNLLQINNTTTSLNSSTASLVSIGGISIGCTSDALSSTAGGSLTIAGGLSINKKTYTGDTIGIDVLNSSKKNKLMLYQSNGDLTQTDLFTGFGVSSGSLIFQSQNTTNDFIFYSSNTSGNSSEVFRIKGTNEVQFIGNTQRYSVIGGGDLSTSLSIQGKSIGSASSLNLYTADGDNNDNIDIKIVSLGSPNNITNSEYLKIGWDRININYIISTISSGTGQSRSIILQSNNNNNQLTLNTNGSVLFSSTLPSINASNGGLILNGGLSINNTNDAISYTQGGAVTINGGISINKNMYIGRSINIFSSSGNILLSPNNSSGDFIISNPSAGFIFAGNNTGSNLNCSLQLYNLNNVKQSNYSLLEINVSSGSFNIISQAGGTATLNPININSGNSYIYLNTTGNIGINNTSPNFSFDVNGGVQSNNYSNIKSLTIYSTQNSTSINSSGSLSVLGGASILKDLYIGGKVFHLDTTNASLGAGSVVLQGGLNVNSSQIGTYGSGALTVAGGASFGQSVYIGQNLYVTGSIKGGNSTITYLTLTATDGSISLTNGSLITFGGITSQCYINATNISNGGSFLTPGGASIGKDVYIGGNIYNYNSLNMFGTSSSLIYFNDTTSVLRFSIDRNTSSNDLSISRYNSSGILIDKSINISNSTGIITLTCSNSSTNSNTGSLITPGGITINSSTNSVGLLNGGALTVSGGISISKDVYIGGNVIFSSTTQSNDVSSGSLLVYGGMGISGNMNILGNTIINGNLTIIGTTASIQSTNTLITDNIIVLNSGPSGTKDSGFLVQRYQTSNDGGLGDVVNSASSNLDTLPSQSGLTLSQIKFSTATSSVDNYYTGWWIKITSGFSYNQVRKITGFIGATRIATISAPFTTQNPTINDTVSFYNKPYVGLIYSESNNIFEFGSTVQDPGQTSVVFTDTIPIKLNYATIVSTQQSVSATSGAIVVSGGIGIICTSDSTSITAGGGLTIAGGASIAKTLNVGSLYVNSINITPNSSDILSSMSFTAANNVISPANISGLLFGSGVWGADIFLSAQLTATSNAYANYKIRIVNQVSIWDIITTYVGSNIITFSITNSGQLQYTTSNFSGFTSLIFKFKAITN